VIKLINNKRAITSEQKRFLIERLLIAWNKEACLRLGQLLSNAVGDDLFNIEDQTLIDKVETFINDIKGNKNV
jgi:hypothetical protein